MDKGIVSLMILLLLLLLRSHSTMLFLSRPVPLPDQQFHAQGNPSMPKSKNLCYKLSLLGYIKKNPTEAPTKSPPNAKAATTRMESNDDTRAH